MRAKGSVLCFPESKKLQNRPLFHADKYIKAAPGPPPPHCRVYRRGNSATAKCQISWQISTMQNPPLRRAQGHSDGCVVPTLGAHHPLFHNVNLTTVLTSVTPTHSVVRTCLWVCSDVNRDRSSEPIDQAFKDRITRVASSNTRVRDNRAYKWTAKKLIASITQNRNAKYSDSAEI